MTDRAALPSGSVGHHARLTASGCHPRRRRRGGALRHRWACIGAGLELGLARVATTPEAQPTIARTRGFVGVPLSLTLGSRAPVAFVLDVIPRVRLGTDFGGQEPGDGGYKPATGLFVGLGLTYTLAR